MLRITVLPGQHKIIDRAIAPNSWSDFRTLPTLTKKKQTIGHKKCKPWKMNCRRYKKKIISLVPGCRPLDAHTAICPKQMYETYPVLEMCCLAPECLKIVATSIFFILSSAAGCSLEYSECCQQTQKHRHILYRANTKSGHTYIANRMHRMCMK